MADHELTLSEEASKRARQLQQAGNREGAKRAFLEAAEHMLRFSRTQTGERKRSAQVVTEALIDKARKLAEPGAPAAPSATPAGPVSPAPQETPAPADAFRPAQPQPGNQDAISRDMKSFQAAARGGRPAVSEDVGKFRPVPSPNVHFSDIAGLESVKQIVQLKVIQPILHPELYERFDKAKNGGILLYGPPGTGKTMIARAIATETQLDFFSVRCSDIVGKTFGDGERNLKALFDAARQSGRAMIFFDEFESLACKRGGGSTIMNRIVPELLSQMDGFQQAEGQLIVLASTNRPWDLDSAVLRPPRMTERIYIGLPDQEARKYLVQKALDGLPMDHEPDFDALAERLEGYNCADIVAFTEKVKDGPILRGLREGEKEPLITAQDMEDALSQTHSSVQQTDLVAFSRWEATQSS